VRPSTGRATVAGFDVVEHAKQVRAAIGLTGQYAAIDELLTGPGEFGALRPASRPAAP
jgi:ABC-2 type transport system ATP-binding protein